MPSHGCSYLRAVHTGRSVFSANPRLLNRLRRSQGKKILRRKLHPKRRRFPQTHWAGQRPMARVTGFLQAVNDNKLAKAVQYLDTKLPEGRAEELAKQLKSVLDSGLSSSINGVSREPQGDVTDDLRITREKIGIVETPSGNLEILLDRVTRPQLATVWLFSSETLARIPNAYEHLERDELQIPTVISRAVCSPANVRFAFVALDWHSPRHRTCHFPVFC